MSVQNITTILTILYEQQTEKKEEKPTNKFRLALDSLAIDNYHQIKNIRRKFISNQYSQKRRIHLAKNPDTLL
ncbi:hypothetical protein OUO06_20130 (plasmid) [Photobacterium damselae]|uniref:hypothetical protein n=1 Tax=Photobacterium damselae TaxID=38293 RepID=UPI003C6E29FD